MRLIAGADLLEHPIHADERGALGAFQEFDSLPFPLERVFFIKVGMPRADRGGHANSCDEFIITLAGSVRVELDNGREQTDVELTYHGHGLWVRSGVLIRLCDFARDTVLLVCASARYEETRHFATPQPHLALAARYA